MGIVKCLRLRKRADHFPSTCKKMVINDGSTTIIITHIEMYFPLNWKLHLNMQMKFSLNLRFSFSKGGNKEAVRYKKSAKHNATNKAHIEKKTIAQWMVVDSRQGFFDALLVMRILKVEYKCFFYCNVTATYSTRKKIWISKEKLTRFLWHSNRKVCSPDNHRTHQHKPNNLQPHEMPLYTRIVHLQPRNCQSTWGHLHNRKLQKNRILRP